MTKINERTTAHISQSFEVTDNSVGFDPTRYEHLLNDISISDAEKRELLNALWGILSNFVQLGFGVHPIQQALAEKGTCGKQPLNEGVLTASLLECEKQEDSHEHPNT